LRENLTSSSYGEGLETDRATAQVPRQSLTRQLFFKALKQTLRIKTFVGTSANAVRTQVWTALIAMLVLKYLQLKSKFSWSLSTLAALLRQQLLLSRSVGMVGRSFSGSAGSCRSARRCATAGNHVVGGSWTADNRSKEATLISGDM